VQEDEGKAMDAATDTRLNQTLQVLKQATQDRRTLVVAAADLAHVGPAFGGHPLDERKSAQLEDADQALLAQICSGSAEGFLGEVKRVQDQNNVCGIPPIYLALRLLAPVQGTLLAYNLCPADERNTSQVSVCGVTFTS
jgi:AmmeMemoRadiSam system protein B